MASTAPINRGAFIVIEGLDRSGKTTQVKKLELELAQRGNQVKLLRFPDRTTTIGQMIDKYLKSKSDLEDHVIHLLFSANRWELSKLIETEIAQGCTIICDRYTYSGMAYSAAKGNPSLSLQWAREFDVGLPRPDLVVFLDLEPDEAEKRAGYGDEKYEKRETQENVRKIFLGLTDSGHEEAEDMLVINARGSVEEVGQKIADAAFTILATVRNGALGKEIRRIRKW